MENAIERLPSRLLVAGMRDAATQRLHVVVVDRIDDGAFLIHHDGLTTLT